MILCVFEGERDRCVFDTLIRLFFKHKEKQVLCCGENIMPLAKGLISQDKILINQIEKFIKPKNSIAILAAFPLFLYEYFK